MRRAGCAILAGVVAAAALSGCLRGAADGCFSGKRDLTFFLADGGRLVEAQAAGEADGGAGSAPGNGFVEAFLTDDIHEWRSDALPQGLRLLDDVTIDLWVENVGTPAPIVIGGENGEAYHLFNQFGSDRGFMPAWAVEYAEVAPEPGSVDHYTETLEAPTGGFVFEVGDHVRLLLTSLVLDDAEGSGHRILYGGDTPSQVRFTASCRAAHHWQPLGSASGPVFLPVNQGLLTGAVPGSAVNQAHYLLTWTDELDPGRITVVLAQGLDGNPVKDDVDFTLLDRFGRAVWSGGSPYADEKATLWRDNLQAFFPSGQVIIRVDSYSAFGYVGALTVILNTEADRGPPNGRYAFGPTEAPSTPT